VNDLPAFAFVDLILDCIWPYTEIVRNNNLIHNNAVEYVLHSFNCHHDTKTGRRIRILDSLRSWYTTV